MSTHTSRCVLWIALGWTVAVAAAAEDAATFERVEDVTFRAELDGSQEKYVLMTPAGVAAGNKISVLIALHGHGSDRWQFVRQMRGECRAARDVAAAHQMLLVSPDYRATTSWMGPAAEADLLQILQSLQMRYDVDRVILCGGSMGGTAALTFAARHPRLIDGVVSLNGTANLVDYPRFLAAIARSYGGTKEEVPEEYRRRSAEFFPQHFTMPLAATTGGEDEIVPPASVLRLLASVRRHNKHVLGIHQPNGGHSTSYDDTKRALEFVIAAAADH